VRCEILGSHSSVAKNSGLIGCYAASLGKWFSKMSMLYDFAYHDDPHTWMTCETAVYSTV